MPEPIGHADAVVLVAGAIDTERAANWARITQKPLLPVSRYGGAAEANYFEELHSFEQRYAGRLPKTEFENLSQTTSEAAAFARTVVSLAVKIQPKSAMVIMSFANVPDLEDVYHTYRQVCSELGYSCSRIDEERSVPRILPEILSRIAACAFTIVDLTDEKANVYYELGYADALKKRLIVTAREGTTLPFDVKDIPVVFWRNQTGLKEALRRRIEDLPQVIEWLG